MSKIPEIRADKGDIIGVGVDGSGNIIGKNISVVINEARGYGLTLLSPNYFQENSDTDPNFEDWKNGFNFTPESIYYKREYRRESVLDEITEGLEKQQRLLLLGESGTSKSTLLMEMVCYYFDKGYKVLYSEGNEEPREPDNIAEFIRDLIRGGNKVLVAVDNVHDKKMASVFHILNLLRSFNKKENVIFLLSARQPEYNSLLEKEKFTIEDKYRHAIESLFVNAPNYSYDIKPFTETEIKDFIKKYEEYLPEKRKQKSIEENAKEIFEDTGGHPIMVKFAVVGKGLREDVEDRYGRYLLADANREKPDRNRICTVIICSLFHISTLQVTDEVLDKMELTTYANDLDRAILYYSSDGTWKTLHPRWDLELLSYIFGFSNKNLIKVMKDELTCAVLSICKHCDENTIRLIMYTLYATIASKEFVSIDIINSILPIIQDHFRDFIWLYTVVAITYDKLLQHQEAIELYDKALKLDPNYVNALYNKGNTLSNLGKYQEAIELYDKALKIKPDAVLALYNKGTALDNLGRYQEAIECYDKALKIDPGYVDALYNKGTTLDKLDKHQEAMECFDKILKINPIAAAIIAASCVERGKFLYDLHEYGYAEAIECYDEALKIDPNYFDALSNKGLVLFEWGKYKESIEWFDKVLKIDPNYFDALSNKGRALNELGKYQEAIEWLDKALEIDPNHLLLWDNKGYALFKLNKIDEAIQCLSNAIELDSSDADAWWDRSFLLVKKGEINEALNNLEEAIRLDKSNLEAYLESAKTDKDFDSIRDNAKFKELVGLR